RVCDARVVVALVLADGLLDIGRRLVDRRDDRAGRGVGLLPDVDRTRLELHWRRLPRDLGKPEHPGKPRRGAVELVVEVSPYAGLPGEALDPEDPRGAVGLQVGATDEAVAHEQRQDVVA